MNKVFRSVWSEALGAWVAASELCRGRGKGGGKVARGVAAITLMTAAAGAAAAINQGNQSSTSGPSDIALGDYASANGTAAGNSIAIGYSTKTNAQNAFSIGSDIVNGAQSSIVLGNGGVNAISLDATSTNTVFFAPNGGSVTNSANSFAFNPYGTAGTTGSSDSVNISGTVTNAANAVALGSKSSVSAANSVALGAGSVADQVDTVSVGSASSQRKITNVAAGAVTTTSTDAVNGSQLAATNATVADAVKYDTSAHNSVTLGNTGTAVKVTNVAAGAVTTTSTDAVNGSQLAATNATVANAVMYDSTTRDTVTLDKGGAAVKVTNVAAGAVTTTSTDAVNGSQLAATNATVANAVMYDSTTKDTVTLDKGGAAVKVTNVAAGAVTTTSTDAVNGSQLAATNATVANAVMYDSTTKDTVTLDKGGAAVKVSNVAAGAVTTTSTDAVNGSQLAATNASIADSVNSLDAVNGSQLYTVTQNVTQNTTDIASLNTSMNDLSNGTSGLVRQDPVTQALSIGANTNGGTISFAGLQGARVLTGVANGVVSNASVDAINGSQLFNSSTSVAVALGGGAGVDANGGVTAPSYTVGGKQVSDVGSAVSNLDGRVTQNTADIAGIKGDLADVSKTAANAVAYDSADHSKVTLGGTDAAAAVQLTNVAAGDLSATSTDAVNGSQLDATNARVSATESVIANFEATGLTGSVASGTDAAAIGAGADASGDNSTAAGVNSTASGNDSTATGANATASGNNSTAAGANSMASGDTAVAIGGNAAASGGSAIAIGGNSRASGDDSMAFGGNSQASGNSSVAFGGNSSATADNSVALGANSVANEANTVSVGSAGNERRVTNVAPGVNGTDAANVNQLNALRSDVNSSITSLQRSAYGGIAAAMAMPNLMPSSPGKTVVGAGVANYKGYNAFAAGATYRSENNKWLVNGAVSVTPNGEAGVRAQAGYEF
jgi:autotransporter adhesin